MRLRVLFVQFSIVACAAVPATACTYVVNPDGTADFPTIQDAIDASEDGDVICLSDGTFTGDGNRDIDYHGKAITITSQSGDPERSIIDCEGTASDPHRAFDFHSHEDYDSVLNGITITGGYAEDGGAIILESSSVTITGCHLIDNSADDDGGTIWCFNAYGLSLQDCVLSENSSSWGGALYADRCGVIRLTNCSFSENRASGSGGAISSQYTQFIAHGCEFSRNGFGVSSGGAIALGPGTGIPRSFFTECGFYHNRGETSGGAFLALWVSLEFEDCVFDDNYCARVGPDPAMGGAGWFALSDVTFTNCDFLNNEVEGMGGALTFEDDNCTITNCTFYNNSADTGSCLSTRVAPAIYNTILANGRGGEAIDCNGPITISCCDIHGNQGGDWTGWIEDELGVNGNFSADPLFCSPEGELVPMVSGHASPYSLQINSPCLPGNHPHGNDCGLIGAHGQGCGIVTHEEAEQSKLPGDEILVEPTSWGRIKAGYR